MTKIKVAIVQAAPVYYDLTESMKKAVKLIKEAAKDGAKLIAFGETWLPGYPAWSDMCLEAALWDHEPTKEIFAQLKENSISIPGKETKIFSDLAKQLKVAIAIGVNEKTPGTIYNSFLIFDEKGTLAVHHRKLVPTFSERLVWGQGKGNDLSVAETFGVKTGGLICWEHWMPLTRQYMHNLGEQIHIAQWPTAHEMLQVASRHYAFEGRCFVLVCGLIIHKKDIPPGLTLAEKYAKSKNNLLIRGGSAIIGPDGFYLVEPVYDKETILTATLDLRSIAKEQMSLDVSGHYSRQDVFEFGLKNGL